MDLKYNSLTPSPAGQNQFFPINEPYGFGSLPISPQNRDQTSSLFFGDGVHFTNLIPKIVQPASVIGPQNTKSVNTLDTFFLMDSRKPRGIMESFFHEIPATPDLQEPRRPTTKVNEYTQLASQSLHVAPDLMMKVFFSDDNINHLRTTIVKRVQQITADSGVAGNSEGVKIQLPNMEDMFYYMVNIYQNYKIYNGSICFVNLKNQTDIKNEIVKLNSDVLQEYISKLVSQINMYIYYYKDASQLPEQLAVPLLTSMKGSKTLEYNNGFTSGNSIGIASYNEVGNII